MEQAGRTVKLLKNRIYPTYQLFAVMGNRKTDPHDGLRLGALTAMEWLARRLGDEAPPALSQAPGPERYRETDDACLPSLHISQGYVVDVVSLPEQGTWNLQITEPDLGSDPGNPEQKRGAVPGRVIETNVAFRICGKQLECGFQTAVSDPEGTEQPAEVYRLAFVRRLVEHPDFGLTQVLPLTHDVARADTASQLNTLLNLWRDPENQLPCVVFTHLRRKSVLPEPPSGLATGFSLRLNPGAVLFPAKSAPSMPSPAPAVPVVQVEEPPYDMAGFAKYGVTFCRTWLLADALLERFGRQVKLDIAPGDIAVLEPQRFGGGAYRLPYQQNATRRRETMDRLQQEMYTYCRGRNVSFGHIAFLSAARENLLRSTADLVREARDVSLDHEQRLALLQAQWRTELGRQEAERQALTEQLERQRQYAVRLEQEKQALREEQVRERQRLDALLGKKDEDIAYLRRKLSQPKDHTEIAGWVERTFAGRLILHPRAVSLLSDKSARTTDIGLLCDALDFLATDYWARRYENLSTEEMLSRCAEKYGRPFEVTPVGNVTIEAFPEQYKVKYFPGPMGEITDSPLDFHLRVGNDAENLVRIYFLHDDGKKRIVVGSLPRHLKAVTIR